MFDQYVVENGDNADLVCLLLLFVYIMLDNACFLGPIFARTNYDDSIHEQAVRISLQTELSKRHWVDNYMHTE